MRPVTEAELRRGEPQAHVGEEAHSEKGMTAPPGGGRGGPGGPLGCEMDRGDEGDTARRGGTASAARWLGAGAAGRGRRAEGRRAKTGTRTRQAEDQRAKTGTGTRRADSEPSGGRMQRHWWPGTTPGPRITAGEGSKRRKANEPRYAGKGKPANDNRASPTQPPTQSLPTTPPAHPGGPPQPRPAQAHYLIPAASIPRNSFLRSAISSRKRAASSNWRSRAAFIIWSVNC